MGSPDRRPTIVLLGGSGEAGGEPHEGAHGGPAPSSGVIGQGGTGLRLGRPGLGRVCCTERRVSIAGTVQSAAGRRNSDFYTARIHNIYPEKAPPSTFILLNSLLVLSVFRNYEFLLNGCLTKLNPYP